MTTLELLHALATKGIRLMAHGDQLAADAPRAALTDALRQAIRQHKVALLALLAQEPSDETAPEGCVLTTNPQTGQRFLTRLHRCPTCGGTHWGPRADGCWYCLTCATAAWSN